MLEKIKLGSNLDFYEDVSLLSGKNVKFKIIIQDIVAHQMS